MKLEIGKTYIARDGHIVPIISVGGPSENRFRFFIGRWNHRIRNHKAEWNYWPDGRCVGCPEFDLVIPASSLAKILYAVKDGEG